jgi:Zn-dependent peptidase ImmA (M78 family)
VLERGFVTWSENYAASKRKELGLRSDGPLDPRKLAESLSVLVVSPPDIPGLKAQTLEILLRNDGKTPSCWSAVTLVSGRKVVVVLNSSHSPARQASDLTHELAHLIRGHVTQEVNVSAEGLMLLSSYDRAQEEEADWLSGTLLLPRAALISIKRRRLDLVAAAAEYGVSVPMLNYRMARTGVAKQFA